MKERRRYPRVKVKGNILLYNGTAFAEVVDISEGGLYCRYLADVDDEPSPIKQIDLINASNKVFVEHIACNDLNWLETSARKLFNTTVVRHCRLEFADLSAAIRTDLERFIESMMGSARPAPSSIRSSSASVDA